MKLLTLEETLLMHYVIMTDLQGKDALFGLLNPTRLESAIEKPTFELWGTDAYPGDAAKAAAISETIITGHPFADGNKRLGITAGIVWLMTNNHKFAVTDDEIVEAALGVAAGEWNFERLVGWFESHIAV